MSTPHGHDAAAESREAALRVAGHVPDDPDVRQRAFVTLLRQLIRAGR